MIKIDYEAWREDRDTYKAHLFIIDGKEVWFPKSHVDRLYIKTKKIYVTPWIAEKKGFL